MSVHARGKEIRREQVADFGGRREASEGSCSTSTGRRWHQGPVPDQSPGSPLFCATLSPLQRAHDSEERSARILSGLRTLPGLQRYAKSVIFWWQNSGRRESRLKPGWTKANFRCLPPTGWESRWQTQMPAEARQEEPPSSSRSLKPAIFDRVQHERMGPSASFNEMIRNSRSRALFPWEY